MKTVNLLPQWYIQQQQQGKNLRVHLGIMVLLGAALMGAKIAAVEHVSSLRNAREALSQRVNTVGDPNPQLQAQQTELKRLENVQLAYRELGNTIPMSAVIQQVQNDMTIGMALSRVNLDVHAEAVKGSGLIGDSRHPPRSHNVAHIVVVGVAPNDVQIAQLVGKISSNPLFSDVSLNYTHTELLNDRSIRRFEIQMSMDLERLAVDDGSSDSNKASQQAHSAGGDDHAG
jgi:hypothetical protein